ncbi:MAG: hypothetical protein J0L75_08590 [Spirochaetes bacterium]|nr:hypothetical protein [Spirochaetota bacterium]
MPRLDRSALRFKPLADRANRVAVETDFVDPAARPANLSDIARGTIEEAAGRIRAARDRGRPVMLAFGAHTIKNGLGPVLAKLLREGWFTHLATNGAGIIHDWEFAFQGKSSEHVAANVERGEFGNWQETGHWINLALAVGAWEGRGYGESVGALIERGGLALPTPERLKEDVLAGLEKDPESAAAAADLLGIMERFRLAPGPVNLPFPWKRYSLQAEAFRLGIPFTGHPMIGHDIIYNHPMNHGGAIGRTAVRDFLTFAEGVSRLEGGVYLSVGSAVMSPMIFEKSMSMGQNLALQAGARIQNHYIAVVDLNESRWDWRRGEPPHDQPDYYIRYMKSFSRMGGALRYVQADNRDFFLALGEALGAGG